MDEKKKELNELIGYGNRLLDDMASADAATVTLLRGVLTHIHDIAVEYAGEAAVWRGKYEAAEEALKTLERQMKEQSANTDNQAMLEVQTSLKKLKKAVKKIGKKNRSR